MQQPSDTLQTERLFIRRFQNDEFELLYRLHRDERVMRFAGGATSREATQKVWDERVVRYYDEHPGLGIWLTCERTTGEPVGVHLLNHLRGESLVQVGYLLYPEHWGRGYATEMAAAVVNYGFTEAELPEIVAITYLANLNSQHVLQKVGLKRHGERTLSHPGYEGRSYAWFVAERQEWLQQRQQDRAEAAAVQSS